MNLNTQIPLYQQIGQKFEDVNYLQNTKIEMVQPNCLKKPMYVVGKGSRIPYISGKTASLVVTFLGIVSVIPALYWTLKSLGEVVCLPVSSKILRSIMKSARKAAIIPPKGDINKNFDSTLIDPIKDIVKMILIIATAVVVRRFTGVSAVKMSLLGMTAFVMRRIYCALKNSGIKIGINWINKDYVKHMEKGPKHLRMSVMVEGERIDTYVVMQNNKIEAGQRWILATNGNGVPAETVVGDLMKQSNPAQSKKISMLSELSTQLKANVLTYNYGGCLASEGAVSTQKAAKIYQAMKKMLEDPKGLAAKEIVFYGHSIGGAIQAQGLRGLKPSDFNKEIKYVCVKDRTFSNAVDQLNSMFKGKFGKALGIFIKHLGWNLNVASQCQELYDNNISQVNINNQYDQIIKADALINKFDVTGKDKALVYSKMTKHAGNSHMVAPDEDECKEIVDQIEAMLA